MIPDFKLTVSPGGEPLCLFKYLGNIQPNRSLHVDIQNDQELGHLPWLLKIIN